MKTLLALSIILLVLLLIYPFTGSAILCAALATVIPNILSVIIDRNREDRL